MKNNSSIPASRINVLCSVVIAKGQRATLESIFKEAEGDFQEVLPLLKEKIKSPTSIKKIELANTLADWANDNVSVVKSLTNSNNINSLRDVAVNFNKEKLMSVISHEDLPDDINGEDEDERVANFADDLSNRLFDLEPNPFLNSVRIVLV